MYCKNCGKETSDTAAFCPYCGARKTVMMQETETIVNRVSYENNHNEEQLLPIYKRKSKQAFFVSFIPTIYVFFEVLVMLARFIMV